MRQVWMGGSSSPGSAWMITDDEMALNPQLNTALQREVLHRNHRMESGGFFGNFNDPVVFPSGGLKTTGWKFRP